MSVIAVTRAGRGAVFSFSSVLSADTHPVVQFGDAIITSMSEIRQCLTMDECAMVAEKVGDKYLADEIRECPSSSSEASSVRYAMEKLWDVLQKRAPKPPTDHAKILQIIIADRISTRQNGVHVRPRGDFQMSKAHKHEVEAQVEEAPVAEVAAEDTPVAEVAAEDTALTETLADAPKNQAPKANPIPRTPRFADTGVITLLADKDGKKYGPENNPKKQSSASADRFAKYVDGQTVAEAKAAGVVNGDFANDTDRGYISIV